jgi:hypothetical protein
MILSNIKQKMQVITLSLFSNEPELGTEIESGIVMTPFPYSIVDETRFEPTTYRP